MEKFYDLPPEAFAEFRRRPFVYLVLRSNGNVSVLGPLYLLWRGEWKKCFRIYLPVLSTFTVAFGIMGLAMEWRSLVLYQAGVVMAGLCFLWGIAWNIWLDVKWNDHPHPRQRALLPAVLWLAAAVSLPLLSMQLGCMLGTYWQSPFTMLFYRP